MAKRKRYKADQIIGKLREVERLLSEGKTIGDAARQIEVSEQTIHRWRNQYGGMKADDVREFKRLQEENRRLKKAVADLTLDKMILKEVAEGKW